MKIRNIITSFRSRRVRRLTQSDSVSFEAFCNESPSDSRRSQTKESSLNTFDISPIKGKNLGYDKFARQEEFTTSRPSLSTILLFIVLSAVFLILPIIYLLNCFDIIYEHQNLKHNPIVKEADHYEPGLAVHDSLDFGEKKIKSLPNPPAPDYDQCKLVSDDVRLDCYPENGANAEGCEARGCCWIPAKTKPRNFETSLNVPYCFYPPNYESYKYINVTETAFGLVAFLKRTYRTAYPDDVETLKMIVKYETDDRLHVKFVDPYNFRYEPAYPEMPIVDSAAINLKYVFEMDIFRPGFKVVRKADNTTVFDSNNFLNFIYAKQFLQISAKLPSKNIYGLGEHTSNLLLSTRWTRYTLFNHDNPPTVDTNLYGTHPFYLVMENTSKSHGVFLFNSNAMDVILQPAPAVTFRTIGGVLDFYFFMGPTPADVVAQYATLVGKPYMPPYWALGFHLCRFGYKTLDRTKEVMERNINAGIPLDTQWNDLDYMNNSNGFTYDGQNFAGLPHFVDELHARGMHYTILIDPGVSGSEAAGSYPPYDEGVKMDIFVKNSTGQIFVGKVWNTRSTVWPDFTHPNTVDYWTLLIKDFHKQVPFDGAWIDMNEPSNFLNGAVTGCPKSTLESPPYVPAVDGGALNYKTMCMSAKHYAGLHYDVHNLFGYTEAIITHFAMAEVRGKRPLIISRSTFSGHGHYAGHWSGDVYSTWVAMRQSVPHLLSFSLFGVPLMGADICGFNGNTTESLCNRWHQLGAFYPFSRNHNTDDGIDQDPVAMGETVVDSTRQALTAIPWPGLSSSNFHKTTKPTASTRSSFGVPRS
ncbi:lysosomal alpha-glucosidase-like isoform X2 [Cylas formicarius]|uniref:lysosomal alpha-glucosidase-like isoform X2 n=1 Tax=Cylas formicarius TaxID=197179 RepID=UPI00295889A6|nr:lysosomal alpha-glucosidase-like isoform X2 [Cylas formicarius]